MNRYNTLANISISRYNDTVLLNVVEQQTVTKTPVHPSRKFENYKIQNNRETRLSLFLGPPNTMM